MINSERIVSVKATDLITLYSVMLDIAGKDAETLQAESAGVFAISENGKTFLASEPVKTIAIGAEVSAATIYMVAANDFDGIMVGTETVEISGNIEKDGRTLYKVTVESAAGETVCEAVKIGS